MRILILALALAVGSASGCKRDEPASVTVAASLRVAPIAEDHPWVIAFLTEVSITRPPGADARLEGRTQPDGRYVMDPVITTDDKTTLADFLRAYEQQHARPPELAPVWELHEIAPNHPPLWQLHFIDEHAGFVVDGGASATLRRSGEVPMVRLKLSPAQGEQFAALTRAQLRRRVAFVIGDEVVSAPVVWEAIPDGEVMLVSHSNHGPEHAAAALLDRLSQAN
jgi:hypothetical protein